MGGKATFRGSELPPPLHPINKTCMHTKINLRMFRVSHIEPEQLNKYDLSMFRSPHEDLLQDWQLKVHVAMVWTLSWEWTVRVITHWVLGALVRRDVLVGVERLRAVLGDPGMFHDITELDSTLRVGLEEFTWWRWEGGWVEGERGGREGGGGRRMGRWEGKVGGREGGKVEEGGGW